MNVVVAPDSFKGSLSAVRAAGIIAACFARRDPAARCILLPQADGGEGTLDVLERILGGERHSTEVVDPLGRPLHAQWLLLPDGRAVVESAMAVGHGLIGDSERNPELLRSTGLGQLLLAVRDAGVRTCLLALGGSATNDCGLGFAEALGYRMHCTGRHDGSVFDTLRSVEHIAHPAVPMEMDVQVLADVRNPLCGSRGATAVYGPQKGLPPEQIGKWDRAMTHFSSVVRRDVRDIDPAAAGMGAAGGLGFAAAAFCGASLSMGADMVRAATGFREALEGADLVITGEGRLDAQSGEGKVIAGIVNDAATAGVPVVAFAGSVQRDTGGGCPVPGLADCFSIAPSDMPLARALAEAEQLLDAAVDRYWRDFSGTR